MEATQDYKKILTEVIQKQMALLGPEMALQRARSVQGLMVMDDGTVASYAGDPNVLVQGLIDEFVQLSGLIVKKTMEPLLAIYPNPTSISKAIQQPKQTMPAGRQAQT